MTKEKRGSTIEGRTCANSKIQRQWSTKLDHSSPTAHSYLVFLTSMIGEFESRTVAIADVKGACLNAEMDEFLVLNMVDE